MVSSKQGPFEGWVCRKTPRVQLAADDDVSTATTLEYKPDQGFARLRRHLQVGTFSRCARRLAAARNSSRYLRAHALAGGKGEWLEDTGISDAKQRGFRHWKKRNGAEPGIPQTRIAEDFAHAEFVAAGFDGGWVVSW
jgi:hypothetical protein